MIHYNKGIRNDSEAFDAMLGQKARPGPNLFSKFLDYGTRSAKIIGGVMEGPAGWAGAAAEFGSMVKDKIDGKL